MHSAMSPLSWTATALSEISSLATGYFRLGRVRLQPLFEIVPLRRQLSPVRFYSIVFEVNFLARS